MFCGFFFKKNVQASLEISLRLPKGDAPPRLRTIGIKSIIIILPTAYFLELINCVAEGFFYRSEKITMNIITCTYLRLKFMGRTTFCPYLIYLNTKINNKYFCLRYVGNNKMKLLIHF